MTPQERDIILDIITRNVGSPAIAHVNTGFERSLFNTILEVSSYARTMAESHERDTALWITRDDRVLRIVDIDDDHLCKIERAITEGTAPATEKERENITAERVRRNLDALKPRKTETARISHLLTEIHALYRTASSNARRHFLRGLANFLNEAGVFMNAEDRREVRTAADIISSVKPGDAQLTAAEGTIPGKTLGKLIAAIDPGVNPDGTVMVVVDKTTNAIVDIKPANTFATAKKAIPSEPEGTDNHELTDHDPFDYVGPEK